MSSRFFQMIILSLATFSMPVVESAVAFVQVEQPGEAPRVSVDKSTTSILKPLDGDGYVDYQMALNQLHLESVDPEDNFALLLWQVLGEDSVPKSSRRAFFEPISFQFDADSSLPKWVDADSFFRHYRFKSARSMRDSTAFIDAALSPWEVEDAPAIEALLSKNQEVLDYLAEGMTRSRFAQPYVCDAPPKMIGSMLFGILELKQIGRMFALRAMLHLGNEESGLAMKDSLSCYRIGRYLSQRPTDFEVILGAEISGWAMEVERTVLEQNTLSQEQMSAHLGDLLEARFTPDLATTFGGFNRWCALDAVQLWARQLGKSGVPRAIQRALPKWAMTPEVDANQSMMVVNEWYDRGVDSLAGKAYETIHTDILKIYEDLEKLESQLSDVPAKDPKALGRQIGAIWITSLFPDLRGFYLASTQKESQVRMVLTAYSLRLFQCEKGQYPKELSELNGKEIQGGDTTVDPYCGKHFELVEVDGLFELKTAQDEKPWKIKLPMSTSGK